jgi:hypothetical protein
VGGIVEVKPAERERAVDRNIAGIAREGLYRSADHLVQLRQEGAADPQTAVDAHVRRLEALRRSTVVERMADGVWRIPPDFCHARKRTMRSEPQGALSNCVRTCLSNSK